MERLTHEADFGLEDWEETLFFVKSDPNGAYNILDIAKYQGYNNEFAEILKTISIRLSTIENTLGDDYDLDRLRELVEADRDGRCVVLPCKAGERIYKVIPRYLNKYGCDHCLSAYGMGRVCEYYDESSGGCKNFIRPESLYDIISKHFSLEMFYDFGKTVFLTREEAEAALRRMQDEGVH